MSGSNQTRMMLLHTIAGFNGREFSASELVQLTGHSQQNIQKHIKNLRAEGVLIKGPGHKGKLRCPDTARIVSAMYQLKVKTPAADLTEIPWGMSEEAYNKIFMVKIACLLGVSESEELMSLTLTRLKELKEGTEQLALWLQGGQYDVLEFFNDNGKQSWEAWGKKVNFFGKGEGWWMDIYFKIALPKYRKEYA